MAACGPSATWPARAPGPPAGGVAIEWRAAAGNPSSASAGIAPQTGPAFELEFGAPLELELWLAWDAQLAPAALDLGAWAAAAPVEVESERARRGSAWLERRRLRLRPVELGELELPGLELAARAAPGSPGPTATSAPLRLRVRSSLAGDSSADLELPPPLALPAAAPLWPWLLALLPLAGGLLWWARRRPAPPPDPLGRARRALAELAAGPGDARPAADRLVALLRAYLAAARGLPADRRTTPQLLRALAAPPSAAPRPGAPADAARVRPATPARSETSETPAAPAQPAAPAGAPATPAPGAAARDPRIAGSLDGQAHAALAAALSRADGLRFAAPGQQDAALGEALAAAARFLELEAEARP